MSLFALGTFPMLMVIGLGSTVAREKKFDLLNKFIGVIIVFFSLFNLNAGLTLTGVKVPWNFSGPAKDIQINETKENEQVVKMDVNWAYSPNQFKIKKGIPVRWEINGINVGGCANSITIPRLKIFKRLQPGLNVIEFTLTETGALPFSCGMGMLTGKFIVE